MKYLIIFFILFSKPVFSQVFSIDEITTSFTSGFPDDFILLCKSKGFVPNEELNSSLTKELNKYGQSSVYKELFKYNVGKKSMKITIQKIDNGTTGNKEVEIVYYNSGSGYSFNVSEIKKKHPLQKSITNNSKSTVNIYFSTKNDVFSENDIYLGVLSNVQDADGNLASIIYIMDFLAFQHFCATF